MFYLLVGKGNSLLQSKWSWASRDKVSNLLTKNSQLKAGMSCFKKCSRNNLLSIVGLSFTTVSNWKSRQRQRPYMTVNKNWRLITKTYPHLYTHWIPGLLKLLKFEFTNPKRNSNSCINFYQSNWQKVFPKAQFQTTRGPKKGFDPKRSISFAP